MYMCGVHFENMIKLLLDLDRLGNEDFGYNYVNIPDFYHERASSTERNDIDTFLLISFNF